VKLAWNAIVKNESAIIERCVKSLLPYIDCGIVADTGSTDDTVRIIQRCFDGANKPLEVGHVAFHDFAQSRNAALDLARESRLGFDYLVLSDADMELVVPDRDAFERSIARGVASYDMQQRAGGLHYWNRRLLNRKSKARYLSPVHEYLDESQSEALEGPYFIDHADGANRPGKFERDIKLLREVLETEPNNTRYWFYLGQSYRDSGDWENAAKAYARCVELGGWDQERWNALYNYAFCVLSLGDESKFVHQMLLAWNLRPSRAETLYDLAKYFREQGNHMLATHFTLAGMKIPYSKDALFVSDFVYRFGLREELSISGFYQPETRAEAFRECDALALDREAPEVTREQARTNLFHYLRPLSEYMRFSSQPLPFDVNDDWKAMNPTIARDGDGFIAIVRTVNYEITESGHYAIHGNAELGPDNPIVTRNFLVRLSKDMAWLSQLEIHDPINMPAPQWGAVRGFEDMRLFPSGSGIWFSSCVREMNPEGWCEQIVGQLVGNRIADWWKVIPSWQKQHEKSWAPWRGAKWVYRLGTIIDAEGQKVLEEVPKLATNHIGGGTQFIPFESGWLGLVHEARPNPWNGKRYYSHRFAVIDLHGKLTALSRPFVFHDRQIEYAMGLARAMDGSLVVSYGVRDCEARIARLFSDEVAKFLDG
jgi:tetratricopeptide (TPR) repeat protein/predicted GH43/DUF377 family glycosyl hydrolase